MTLLTYILGGILTFFTGGAGGLLYKWMQKRISDLMELNEFLESDRNKWFDEWREETILRAKDQAQLISVTAQLNEALRIIGDLQHRLAIAGLPVEPVAIVPIPMLAEGSGENGGTTPQLESHSENPTESSGSSSGS